MKRQVLAVVLSALLSGSCFGQTQSSPTRSPEEQLRAIDVRSPVEVRLNDGAKLRGWVGEVSGSGFVLNHEEGPQAKKSQVAFNQIKAVKQIQSVNPRHTTRNLLIGVGVALAAVVVVVAVVAGKTSG